MKRYSSALLIFGCLIVPATITCALKKKSKQVTITKKKSKKKVVKKTASSARIAPKVVLDRTRAQKKKTKKKAAPVKKRKPTAPAPASPTPAMPATIRPTPAITGATTKRPTATSFSIAKLLKLFPGVAQGYLETPTQQEIHEAARVCDQPRYNLQHGTRDPEARDTIPLLYKKIRGKASFYAARYVNAAVHSGYIDLHKSSAANAVHIRSIFELFMNKYWESFIDPNPGQMVSQVGAWGFPVLLEDHFHDQPAAHFFTQIISTLQTYGGSFEKSIQKLAEIINNKQKATISAAVPTTTPTSAPSPHTANLLPAIPGIHTEYLQEPTPAKLLEAKQVIGIIRFSLHRDPERGHNSPASYQFWIKTFPHPFRFPKYMGYTISNNDYVSLTEDTPENRRRIRATFDVFAKEYPLEFLYYDPEADIYIGLKRLHRGSQAYIELLKKLGDTKAEQFFVKLIVELLKNSAKTPQQVIEELVRAGWRPS